MDNERFEHENDFKGLDLTDTTESYEQEDEPAGSDENDASDLSDTYEYHDGPAGQDLNDPADPVKPAESVSVLDADRADTADRNASGFAADRADTADRKDLLQAPQILSIRMLPAQEAADITACITQRNPEDILPDAEKKTKKAANGWRWHLP